MRAPQVLRPSLPPQPREEPRRPVVLAGRRQLLRLNAFGAAHLARAEVECGTDAKGARGARRVERRPFAGAALHLERDARRKRGAARRVGREEGRRLRPAAPARIAHRRAAHRLGDGADLGERARRPMDAEREGTSGPLAQAIVLQPVVAPEGAHHLRARRRRHARLLHEIGACKPRIVLLAPKVRASELDRDEAPPRLEKVAVQRVEGGAVEAAIAVDNEKAKPPPPPAPLESRPACHCTGGGMSQLISIEIGLGRMPAPLSSACSTGMSIESMSILSTSASFGAPALVTTLAIVAGSAKPWTTRSRPLLLTAARLACSVPIACAAFDGYARVAEVTKERVRRVVVFAVGRANIDRETIACGCRHEHAEQLRKLTLVGQPSKSSSSSEQHRFASGAAVTELSQNLSRAGRQAGG